LAKAYYIVSVFMHLGDEIRNMIMTTLRSIIGEMTLDGGPRSASVMTMEPTTVVDLTPMDLGGEPLLVRKGRGELHLLNL
jgi:hypothetical protein